MTKPMGYGLAVLVACALMLAGCGGSGSGEPTVTQTIHDELQAELDAALADLATEREAKADETTARSAAETEVARLKTVVGMADDEADADGSLHAQLNAARARVAELTTQLETTTGSVTRLEDELETAAAEATRLETLVGMVDDEGDADGSLYAQLNAANAEVTRLETLTGSMDDTGSAADSASLYAQLNHAKAEVTRLTGLLTTAQSRVTELEGEIGSTGDATSLRGMLDAANTKVNRLTAELEAANTSLTALRGQLTTAQQQAQQAQQQAQQAQQQAQEAQQEVSSLDANQRAQNLKEAFTDVGEAAPASPNVKMTTTKGRLTLTQSRHKTAMLSGNGLRSATMALTSGGDTGKIVFYTDLELSRAVLDHYGNRRNTNDRTVLDLSETDIALGSEGRIAYDATPQATTRWRIALPSGVSTSVAAVDSDDDNFKDDLPTTASTPKRANSYTGYLHGQPGTFVCMTDNCKVQVTPVYSTPTAGEDNGRLALLGTNVISATPTGDNGAFEAGGTLHFKPSSSAKFDLYTGSPIGSADAEYMVFGYWREDPTSPAAGYDFGVFADVVGAVTDSDTFTPPTSPAFVSATYDGVAVGAYVEQDPNNPVDTHRQGEFTADASLTATGGTATDINGTIDDFVTTPTGGSAAPRTAGRWVVTLGYDESNAKEATINLADGGSGMWTHEYVPARTESGETVPPAVTGVFDVEVTDFVHILGAFGAER